MDADEEFANFLESRGKQYCPTCDRKLERGDVSWNNADTGSGTPCVVAQIVCQRCDSGIANWNSWYPFADGFEDFVENVLPDLDNKDWEK